MNLSKFWLLLYLVCSAKFINAQFQYGAKLGGNYNLLASSEENNDLSGFGYHLGLFTEYRLKNNFAGVGEILFTKRIINQMFYQTNPIGSLVTYKNIMIYNYMDIPLLVSYIKPSGIQFYLGPELSLLLGGKSIGTVSNYDGVNEVKKDYVVSGNQFKQGLAPILFGARIGLAYNFKNGIFCKLTYHRSISSWYSSNSFFNLFWNTMFFSVGYKFKKQPIS
jgi:hypothetical protein